MKLIRMRGDISIYINEKGTRYHKLGYTGENIIAESNAKRRKDEITIAEVNKYIVRYDRCGKSGYRVYQGRTLIKEDIWYMDSAIKECNKLQRAKRKIKE